QQHLRAPATRHSPGDGGRRLNPGLVPTGTAPHRAEMPWHPAARRIAPAGSVRTKRIMACIRNLPQVRQVAQAWISLWIKAVNPSQQAGSTQRQATKETTMSARLQHHFQQLREELATDEPLDADDRAALLELMQDIDLKLARELASAPEASLVDGVNLVVERFEGQHPALSGTRRNILQSLANMGI